MRPFPCHRRMLHAAAFAAGLLASATALSQTSACSIRDGRPVGCGETALARAQALVANGYCSEALTEARIAEVQARRHCPDCAELGLALLQQAHALTQLERDRAAFQTVQAAVARLEISEPRGLALGDALTLFAKLSGRVGERAAMEGRLQRAFAQFESLQAQATPQYAEALKTRGILRDFNDDLAGMRADWSAALALFQRVAPGGPGEIDMLILQALSAYNIEGDLQSARALLMRAAAFNQGRGQRNRRTANLAYHLGEVERRTGHYEAAAREIRRSIDLSESFQAEPRELSATGGVLALTQISAGHLDAAKATIDEAMNRFGDDPANADDADATALYAGWVAMAAGEPARARRYFERALARWSLPDKGDTGEKAKASLGLARALLALGEVRAAMTHLNEARSIYVALAPDSLALAEVQFALGDAGRQAGDAQAAERAYCQASTVLESARLKVGDPLQEATFRGTHAEVFFRCMESQLLAGANAAALQTLERARAHAARGDLERSDTDFARLLPESLRAPWRAWQLEAGRQTGGREQLADAARRHAPQAAALLFPQIPSAAQLQANIPRDSTVLLFAVGEERTWLLAVERASMRRYVIERSADALTGAVQQLRGRIEGNASPEAVRAAGEALFRTLLGPALQDIPADHRLLVSPDGPLYSLPFAALWDATSGQYLIQSRPIRIIESLRDLARTGVAARPTPTLQLLAVADPARSGGLALAGAGVLAPLGHAREEVERVAQLLPRPRRVLTGQQASEAAVLAAMAGARVIHFATHAVIEPQLPMESAIVLASPPAGDAGSDGLLQVHEIFEGPPLDADLVVLAACETARGPSFRGAGIIGFPRAFRYAGARSVLATLWPVADASSAALMAEFYRQRKSAGDDALALQRAILAHLHGEPEAGSSPVRGVGGLATRGAAPVQAPWRWAAFEIFGAPAASAQP